MHRKDPGAWPHPLPCRLKPRRDDGIRHFVLGDLVPGLAEGWYDPVLDRVTMYDGTLLQAFFEAYLEDPGPIAPPEPGRTGVLSCRTPEEAWEALRAAPHRQGIREWPPPLLLSAGAAFPESELRALEVFAGLLGRPLLLPEEAPRRFPLGGEALPVRSFDLFRRMGPLDRLCLHVGKDARAHLLLALRNRESRPLPIEIPFLTLGLSADRAFEVFDLLEERPLQGMRGTLALELGPGELRLLALVPASVSPILLGSTAHPSLAGPDLREVVRVGEGSTSVWSGEALALPGRGLRLHFLLPEGIRGPSGISCRNLQGQDMPYGLEVRDRHLSLQLASPRPRRIRWKLAFDASGRSPEGR